MDRNDLFAQTLKPGGILKNNRMYFIETPGDAPQKKEGDARDRSKWTIFRVRNAEYLEKILEPLSNELRLLDLGTGPNQFKDVVGKFTQSLRADFNAYDDVDVIADLSKELPFQDASFDIVLSTNFLEHNPDPELSLQETHRILKPHGYTIGIVPFLVGVHQRPYDFFRYTDIQLERYLSKLGFREITIVPLGSTLDTYKQLTRQFFQRRIGEGGPRAMGWKFLWKLQQLISFLGTKMTPRIDPPMDRDYTLGYAWHAKK